MFIMLLTPTISVGSQNQPLFTIFSIPQHLPSKYLVRDTTLQFWKKRDLPKSTKATSEHLATAVTMAKFYPLCGLPQATSSLLKSIDILKGSWNICELQIGGSEIQSQKVQKFYNQKEMTNGIGKLCLSSLTFPPRFCPPPSMRSGNSKLEITPTGPAKRISQLGFQILTPIHPEASGGHYFNHHTHKSQGSRNRQTPS